MKTSRQQVYDYILAHRLVSAGDISRALRMTQANARHHLGILEAEGLVRVKGVRRDSSRGRPVQLYSPSESILGNNLERLSGALLEELLAAAGEVQKEVLLRQVARRMASRRGSLLRADSPESGSAPSRGSTMASLPQRLYAAVTTLNDLQYQARWEARADGPHLSLGHCPYANLAEIQPQICRLDEMFIGELLGQPVTLIARLKLDRRGVPFCLFRLIAG